MSNTGGIGLSQLGKDSLLRCKEDFYFAPIAATTNYLVTTVDPSTLTVGTALTLTTAATGLMFRKARRVTLTLDDDDSGGGMTVTVRISGQRWGQPIFELLTVTTVSGTAITGTSANCYDEVLSIIPQVITGADSGDDLVMGIDGTSFGLQFPIDNIADVQSIINVSTNTEAAATAISSTTVQAGAPSGGVYAGGSYIKGITLATTDRWTVRYLMTQQHDLSGVTGVWR